MPPSWVKFHSYRVGYTQADYKNQGRRYKASYSRSEKISQLLLIMPTELTNTASHSGYRSIPESINAGIVNIPLHRLRELFLDIQRFNARAVIFAYPPDSPTKLRVLLIKRNGKSKPLLSYPFILTSLPIVLKSTGLWWQGALGDRD